MNTVCIFSSDDVGEIEAVKDLLEEHNIPTMIKNFYTQNVFGGLKLFTGHDAIAGSIQIFVREDDLEKGLELLKGDEEETVDEGNVVLETEQANNAKNTSNHGANELKRLIYVGYILSVFSFLIVPYFINIPILMKLSKTRKTLFKMLLILGTILMLFGIMVLIRIL
jgi:hypothetical protein